MSSLSPTNLQGSLDSNSPHFDTCIAQFVKENESGKCIICEHITDISQHLVCGHRLCEGHVDNAPNEKCVIVCSFCKEITPRDQIILNIRGGGETKAAKIYCINRNMGCQAILNTNLLDKHLENCKYSPKECVNADKGCLAKLMQDDMMNHLKHDCQYQPEACKHCTGTFTRKELKDHVDNDCPSVPLDCNFICGIKAMVKFKMNRRTRKCKKRRCIFHDAGCTFKGVSSEVDKHETDISTHLAMVTKQTTDMVNEFSQQIEKIKLSLASHGEKNITSLLRKLEDLGSNALNDQVKDEIKKLKECFKQLSEKRLGPTGGNEHSSSCCVETTRRFEQQLALHDKKLSELNLRFQLMETASYDGILLWKIRDYSRRKQEAMLGRTISLFSQPFYTSRFGYKMCGRIYLNGDGFGKGTHLSFFFAIMNGDFDAFLEWPFKPKVTMMLLSQDGATPNICDTFKPEPSSSSFNRPQWEMNVPSVIPLFIPHVTLETAPYLQDDTIFLMIKVDRSGLIDL